MKLYAYARYSSDNQREQSIDEQFREIQDYCSTHEHIILKKYCDYARSGKYDIRPQYNAMLNDCITNSDCDGIIVFDVTRFSRGGELGIVDSVKLAQHNKTLLSVTEQIGDNDFAGKLVKYLKFLMAEEDITKLSNNVKRGKRETALACEWNGGTPPLGYNVVNKKLVINEIEAEAVKIIFNRVASGYSYNMIIDELNSKGYKTKAGNEFKKTSIHEILHNKKYIGIIEYGRIVTVKNPFDKSCRTYENDPENIITFVDGCPAIIDKDLFDRVQIIKSTRKHNSKAKTNYLLTGKVFCSDCGKTYVGSSSKSHGKQDYYYICSAKKNRGVCNNRNIKKEVLENSVTNLIINEVKSDDFYSQITVMVDTYNKKIETSENTIHNKEIKKNITRIKSRITKAKEAYLNGIFSLDEYQVEKAESEQAIADLESKYITQDTVPVNKKMLRLACQKLSEQIDKNIALDLCDYVIIQNETLSIRFGSKLFNLDKDIVGNHSPF